MTGSLHKLPARIAACLCLMTGLSAADEHATGMSAALDAVSVSKLSVSNWKDSWRGLR